MKIPVPDPAARGGTGTPSRSPKPEFNPVDLIGDPDLEDKLKELVHSFITEDKAKQAIFRKQKGTQQHPSPTVPRDGDDGGGGGDRRHQHHHPFARRNGPELEREGGATTRVAVAKKHPMQFTSGFSREEATIVVSPNGESSRCRSPFPMPDVPLSSGARAVLAARDGSYAREEEGDDDDDEYEEQGEEEEEDTNRHGNDEGEVEGEQASGLITWPGGSGRGVAGTTATRWRSVERFCSSSSSSSSSCSSSSSSSQFATWRNGSSYRKEKDGFRTSATAAPPPHLDARELSSQLDLTEASFLESLRLNSDDSEPRSRAFDDDVRHDDIDGGNDDDDDDGGEAGDSGIRTAAAAAAFRLCHGEAMCRPRGDFFEDGLLLRATSVHEESSRKMRTSVATARNGGDSDPSRSARMPEERFDISVTSAVGYAKGRYRAAQERSSASVRMARGGSGGTFSPPSGDPRAACVVLGRNELLCVVPSVHETRSKFESGGNFLAAAGPVPGRQDASGRARRPIETARPSPSCDSISSATDSSLKIGSKRFRRVLSFEPAATGYLPHSGSLAAPAAKEQRPSSAAAVGVPVRPFLTLGSVAERVSIFERCPSSLSSSPFERRDDTSPPPPLGPVAEQHQPARAGGAAWRASDSTRAHHHPEEPPQEAAAGVDHAHPPSDAAVQPTRNSAAEIPRFYFPFGRPQAADTAVLSRVVDLFQQFPDSCVPQDCCGSLAKACGFPLYWKRPLLLAAQKDHRDVLELNAFREFFERLISTNHDAASQLVAILTKGERNFLIPEDFHPLIQDVIDTHPGLMFLREASEFHSRYVNTVTARIFYCVNRSWSGFVSLVELRRSDLLATIEQLEQEEDINQVHRYFSYEHFYVIYCKFWELDMDHDMFLDKNDLARYNDFALSQKIVDRIFSGAVMCTSKNEPMAYQHFVWFLLSAEDKRNPTAIEYWFRCMDLDGDGFLRPFELQYFYEEQTQRLEALGVDALPFPDCLRQILDMVAPSLPGCISLRELKRCKMAPVFFYTFLDLEKYLENEQRDPFVSQRDPDAEMPEMSDWDRYAASEYEALVADEISGEQQSHFLYDENEDPLDKIGVLVKYPESADSDESLRY